MQLVNISDFSFDESVFHHAVRAIVVEDEGLSEKVAGIAGELEGEDEECECGEVGVECSDFSDSDVELGVNSSSSSDASR